MFKPNHHAKVVQLFDGILDFLKEEKLDTELISVHPEFGSWMIELVPTSAFHLINR